MGSDVDRRDEFFRSLLDPPPGQTLGVLLGTRGSAFGHLVLSVERTASTNALARELAGLGAPHGSVVVAREQTGGRGRWSRRWFSPPGGLYLSVLMRPGTEGPGGRAPSLLPLIAAVAAAEGLGEGTGIAVQLRWPNDLEAGGGKLGGILCESSFIGPKWDFAVVGIGINVNQGPEAFPREIEQRASSVRALTGSSFDVLALAASVVRHLERCWEEDDASVLGRFRDRAAGAEGSRLRVQPRDETPFVAVERGLADDGGLWVELSDGSRRVLHSEDVFYLEHVD